ncbi:type I polyketide synthase [Niveispirillum irakense]|uniref:type I polyketide synthase n=1 Tax=Niveispirillum irakense TaxID=34011 RepID=UPI00048E2998|nr:type I polyketide synthase [Niveispirillum irakense]
MDGPTHHPQEPIAIIGIGCVFPGAVGPDAFWSLLCAGEFALRDVPPDRWDGAALHDPDPAAAGRIITRHAGFIDGADLFDPAFFGLSAREARGMDPRQRLALKVAWWALEDAGIPGWELKGQPVGVYMGASNGEFGGAHADLSAIGPATATGHSTAVLANRISYLLGFTGPSLVVDTACSSALIAVHLACAALRAGECGLALAGGVSLMLRPDPSVAFSRARMLAADGRCKTFSAAADGYGRGEGAGTVVLKRLSDAQRDGDRVLAVILGSALNHNGQSNGITAPSTPAQEALIGQALATAGIKPATVDYVEAHGTGTLLGDPIEAKAIGRALGQAPGRTGPLPVGSVKTNIGHLEAAAGIAGLIKLALVLHHRQVPASLGFAAPNPHIDFAGLNLTVPTAPQSLPDQGRPAVGAVSSFGFGGANCHLIAASPPASHMIPAPAWPQLLVLSAAGPDALMHLAAATAAQVRRQPDAGATLARASHRSRSPLRHRLSIAATDAEHMASALERVAQGERPPEVALGQAPRRRPMTAFLFSGQGAQFAGMARGLVQMSPAIRETLTRAAQVTGLPLLDLLTTGAEIDRTELTQPLMLALQVGLARHWAAWGITPDIVIGHSLGDYAAAVVAGALPFERAMELVAARGRLMAERAVPGGMAAVTGLPAAVPPLLSPDIVIAVENGPGSLTIAGAADALEETLRRLADAGITARRLPVSAAFHSPAMDPVLDPFRDVLASFHFDPLRLPLLCNRTGTILPVGTVLTGESWVRHLRDPVRFGDGVAALAAAGVKLGLEIGPAAVLSRLVPLTVPDLPVVPSLIRGREDAQALLSALGAVWTAGLVPDWNGVDGPGNSRSPLPLYPFEETSFPLLADGTVTVGTVPAPVPPPAASTAIPAAASVAPAVREGADISHRLRTIVADILETTAPRVDPATPFLEMGADSLVLVTAAQRIEAAFGVKIPIRAFFEELSTLDALAGYLASRCAPQAAPPTPAPPMLAPAVPLRPLPVPRAVVDDPAGPRQRQHIAALVAAYTRRTAGSRALADRYRTVLADSRASAGFRPSIKEMLYPIACRSAAGTRMEDVDGNDYLDISMGFGVHLFGHMPDFLNMALQESLSRGLRLGPQSDRAGEAAERIARLSGQDRVAFLNSGTEAVMVALRLARTVTGRTKVVIFRGAYHGHFDGILAEAAADGNVEAGAVPLVAGVAPGAVADTLVLDYGTADSLAALAPLLGQVAAVLVEPVQSRRPDLQPDDFLRRLRGLTQAAGTLLVFDELITGFRIAAGGAQAYFGVRADLVAYGKILGGGLPIGALAGRADVMAAVDGGVWHYGDDSAPTAQTTLFAGTFNKNPLTIEACLAVLAEIERRGDALYTDLNARAARLQDRLDAVLAGTPIRVARFGSVFRFVFTRNLDLFFYHLLLRGIYVWEGRTCFLSSAHTDADCDRLVDAVAQTVAALREGGILDAAPAEPAPKDSLPMTLAQRQLLTLATLDPAGAVAYTLPLLLDLTGPLDGERLAASVATVAARHDGLWAVPDPLAGTLSPAPAGLLPLEQATIAADGLAPAVAERLAVPFDPARPPLLRATLFHLGGEDRVLLLLGHHAALDGLSLQILAGEIAAAYAGQPLPPAPSLRTLLDGHRAALAEGRWKNARDRWMQDLRDAPAGLDLDIAAPRPPVRGFTGGRLVCPVGEGVTSGLHRRALAGRGSLLSVLLAGFVWLLHRHGAADMVIGVPYTGRAVAGPGMGQVVGYCTHLLPLRLRPDATKGTDALLDRVRGTLLDALDHADYPFAHLLDDLAVRRDPARPPLVPVTFNLDRVPPELPFGTGVTARLRPPTAGPDAGSGRFDLACNVVDRGGSLTVELDYDAALFGGGRAERLMADYLDLLSLLAAGGDLSLRHGQGDAAARWALDGTGGRRALPLVARWQAHLRADPVGPAVILDGQQRLDRAMLDRWSDAIAALILAAEVPPGPVGLLLPRTELLAPVLLGCWKAGRAWMMVEPGTPPARAALLLRHAGCTLALAAEGQGTAADACPILPVPPCPPAEGGQALGVDWAVPAPDAIAYILFTSGSTGQPKPVAVPHRAVEWYLEGLLARTALPAGLSYGLVSALAADLGLTATLPALFHGGSLCILSEAAARDPGLMLEALRRWPVDLLKIVPSHLDALLSGEADPALLPRRLLVLGGERASPALLRRLDGMMPASLRVMNHYGPTETTIGVAMGDWQRGADHLTLDAPLPGARLALLGEEGEPVPPGTTGRLYIGGAQLALGYIGLAAETGARFQPVAQSGIDGPLYDTGDLARLDAQGRLEIVGRGDDQVKIRGHRVEPGEVAASLRTLQGVGAAAVVAVPHPTLGPVLVAHVVPAAPERVIDPDSLLAALRGRLPEPMLPARIMICQALPLTANGKLDRAALPVPDWAAPTWGQTDADPAATDMENRLLCVWRALFARPGIGRHDDFFALGGDSILGIRMVARLHQDGLLLKAADLYRHPTVAALAPLIRPAGLEAEQGLLTGPVPLLPSQQRWLSLGGALRPHANLSLLLDLAADITPDRVLAAFDRLIAHHDGLRLRARVDGAEGAGIVQFYAPPAPPPLHPIPDGPDRSASLDRLQALADPTETPLVLGWLEGGRGQLLIVLHHWLVDAVSCALLLEDLARLLRDPAASLGAKTLSLRQWGQGLAAYADTAPVRDQMDYWALCTDLPPPALPERPGTASDGQGMERVTGTALTMAQTSDVLSGPAIQAGLEMEDLLLAALTLAMGRLTGEALLFVELEGHGRTPPDGMPDPARTVGWFTARHPAWFDLTGVEEGEAAMAVRDQRLSIPNRGQDYGLLRWLGPAPLRQTLAAGHHPAVGLNWLGRMPAVTDAPFTLVSWRPGCPLRGAERAADLPRPHALAVEVMLVEGRLRLDLFHDSARFDPAVMEKLVADMAATLLRLASLAPAAMAPTQTAPPLSAPSSPLALDADDLAALAASL